jgi:hypothetical protein
MTDFAVRPVTEDERRSTFDLLGRSLHANRVGDELWTRFGSSWPAEHKFGAFDDGGAPIGIASSFATEIAVPGGGVVALAAVDGVGVRADRTRRGVLTAMMADPAGRAARQRTHHLRPVRLRLGRARQDAAGGAAGGPAARARPGRR